eukprot:164188-Pelagomonas_calceolata.AAC.7
MGHAPPSTSSTQPPPNTQAGRKRVCGAAATAPTAAAGGSGHNDDEESALWASVQADGASVSPAIAPYVQQQRQQQQQQQQMATTLQPESMPQLSSLFDVELAASWQAHPLGATNTQAAGQAGGKKRKRGAVLTGAKGGKELGGGKAKMQRAKSKQQGREARLLRMESGQGKGSGKNRGRKASKACAGQVAKKKPQALKKQQQQQQQQRKKNKQQFGHCRRLCLFSSYLNSLLQSSTWSLSRVDSIKRCPELALLLGRIEDMWAREGNEAGAFVLVSEEREGKRLCMPGPACIKERISNKLRRHLGSQAWLNLRNE